MTPEPRLRIAIQKSGRLAAPSLALLEKCGLKFTKSKDQLFCQARNYAVDLLMLRDDDIPELVNQGSCDLGIVGLNVLEEKRLGWLSRGRSLKIRQLAELGFGQCRLSLGVPRDMPFADLQSIQGKTIATTYPEILANWLQSQGLSANIVMMHGAIEVAPRMHVSDLIFDLVSTGVTLAANGLVERNVVMKSQSVLVRCDADLGVDKEALLNKFLSRINGVLRADDSKYIMLHCPVSALEQVKAAIPGAESPTILPLQGVTDKVAVHAVCNETVFWHTMEQLKAAGASAILVLPIEKMLD